MCGVGGHNWEKVRNTFRCEIENPDGTPPSHQPPSLLWTTIDLVRPRNPPAVDIHKKE